MLDSVKLTNFRSYNTGKYKLSPSVSVISGPNGIGKTNLLEAVYILGASKSWRAKDKNLIKNNESFFRVEATYKKRQLSVVYDATEPKKLLRAGNKSLRGEEYIGRMPVVLFEPGHTAIVAGEPAARRKWLDQLLSMADKHYLTALLRYKRALKQRNFLLRSPNKSAIKEQIFAWDVALVEQAAKLYQKRYKFIEYLSKNAPHKYLKVAPKSTRPEFSYKSAASGKDYASELLAKLNQNLAQDIRFGFTRSGPHREDIEIRYKNKPMSAIASRGEIRTATLVSKLVELDYFNSASGKPPILLLDDVFSELDGRRRDFLLSELKGTQTLITTTSTAGISAKLPKNHTVIKLR